MNAAGIGQRNPQSPCHYSINPLLHGLTNPNPFSTTITVTSTPPQATYYAACASNNMITRVDGYLIGFVYFAPGATVATGTGDGSSYDCCVACITNPLCGAYYGDSDVCNFVYPNSNACDGPDTPALYYEGGTSSGLTEGFTVGDGNCGEASADGTTVL